MKKLLALAVLFSSAAFLISCGDDEDNGPDNTALQQAALDGVQTGVDAVASTGTATGADESVFAWTLTKGGTYNSPATTTVTKEGNITTDETWTKGNIYILKRRVTVLDGVTLTIEAGTRVEGDATFSGVDASVLMIARGGTLIAEGTSTEPIIMTSTADDGSLTATNGKGKWGGLVILGKAPISAEGTEVQIEGVPGTDTNGLYGGTDATDDSGSIKYVSIRYGGAVIDAAAGDEINGLTLGGVGSGTVIENIEVYANKDDGIEFFGGSVNITNAIVTQVGDDAIDIDQSYTGTVNNYLVTVDPDSDEGLEVDGREGADKGKFTLTNGTITSKDGKAITCDFKSKAMGTVTNLEANGGKIKLRASYNSDLTGKEDAASNVVDGELVFTNVNATFSVYSDDLDLL